jgi:hypothetical protein
MEYVVNKRRLTLGGLVSAAALGTAVLAATPALAETNATTRVTTVSRCQPAAVPDGPGEDKVMVSDWGTGNTMRTANTDPETCGGEGILGLDALIEALSSLVR